MSVSGQRSSSGNSASRNLPCLWFLFGNHTFAVRVNGEAIFLLIGGYSQNKNLKKKFAAKRSAAIVAMKKINDQNRARTTIRKQ